MKKAPPNPRKNLWTGGHRQKSIALLLKYSQSKLNILMRFLKKAPREITSLRRRWNIAAKQYHSPEW